MCTTTELILAILIFGSCQGQTHFRNPIMDEAVPLPSVLKHQGSYYMTLGIGNTIHILKSPVLSNFRNATRRVIYTGPSDSKGAGSPTLKNIRGDLYIYFSLNKINSPSDTYRMYVIKNLDPCNPLINWSNETRLLPDDDVVAHRGTVMEYNQGELYFIWTGPVEGGAPHNLFIAKMKDPLNVIGPGTLLRAPTMDWEYNEHYGVNESPSILQHRGAIYLVFSASSVATPNYCLGIMGIDGGTDPLIPSHWWNDVNHCVFEKNEEEGVSGPGHASFVTSPDNSETWMVYHAWYGNDRLSRTVRIQKLDWGEMNTPKFPKAEGLDVDLEVPSGEYI